MILLLPTQVTRKRTRALIYSIPRLVEAFDKVLQNQIMSVAITSIGTGPGNLALQSGPSCFKEREVRRFTPRKSKELWLNDLEVQFRAFIPVLELLEEENSNQQVETPQEAEVGAKGTIETNPAIEAPEYLGLHHSFPHLMLP
ncbi:hypothetical protein ACH5RR_039261 [Cinchona calisaya]|uniref:Uncharacterized protein n=1 Tax=Cinchona calisaya TaxID=153742 RepID=A0ABD2XZ44_9GENT